MGFRGLEVVLKIWSYIKLILESLKDYSFKNSVLAKIILNYSILLSICVVIFGFSVFLSSNDRIVSNAIEISINPNNSDPTTPISDFIIDVEYKEPIPCGGPLKITGIQMAGIFQIWEANSYEKNIKNIDLYIFNIDNFPLVLNTLKFETNLVKEKPEVFPGSYISGTNIRRFSTQPYKFDKYNGILLNTSNDFKYSYKLSYIVV